jgi:hypothetical protein
MPFFDVSSGGCVKGPELTACGKAMSAEVNSAAIAVIPPLRKCRRVNFSQFLSNMTTD